VFHSDVNNSQYATLLIACDREYSKVLAFVSMRFAPPMICTTMRGQSVLLATSEGLGWDRIAVERHLVGPGEKAKNTTANYAIYLVSGQRPSHGERVNLQGHLTKYFKPPGSLDLYTEGLLPAMYPQGQAEIISCALDRSLVSEIAEEATGKSNAVPSQIGFRDEAISGLVRLLEEEAQSGGHSGLLYVEHIAHALSLRLLSCKREKEEICSPDNRLSPLRLRRVIEKMRVDLGSELTLKALAMESGYSSNHFLRMFRASTGVSPYQYLLNLRVETAQAMLKDRSTKLIDIALACGFSSHAQFSRVFRRVVA
jgi:AraC family transcriptional regulator